MALQLGRVCCQPKKVPPTGVALQSADGAATVMQVTWQLGYTTATMASDRRSGVDPTC